MSHMASCDQNKYISIAKTSFLLNASFERITCFIDFRAVLATWDIRSGNRHFAHDGTGLLAEACEMRVQ